MRAAAAFVMLGLAMGASVQAQARLPVFAAGSLREVLTEVATLWDARGGVPVVLTLGASGLLRGRIEQGEPADVFASADVEHAQRLARSGRWDAPIVFTRNGLCALTGPAVNATPHTLLATILRSDIRLGTSTPHADPAGDYAWEVFRKAEAIHPGAYAALDAKAVPLTGSAASPRPPPGRGTYAWLMDEGKADVFLTYCTNAVAALHEVPRLKVVQLPPELQVGAAYGLAVRSDAPQSARDFAAFLLSPPAQAVFHRLGFGAP